MRCTTLSSIKTNYSNAFYTLNITSTNMDIPTVRYYYINLDRCTDRRQRCEEQAAKYGIELERISGIDGATLTDADLSNYGRKASQRELSANEHACIKSHTKALRTFLDSGAPFAVILEDDITLFPHTKSTVEHIVTHITGWECVRLYTECSKVYPVMTRTTSDPCELIFPRKVLWGSVANLYTRKAAETILDALQSYDQGFDSFVGCTLLSRSVPICAVFPNAVSTWDPYNKASVIDSGTDLRRTRVVKKTTLHSYLSRRLHVWRVAINKLRMRCLLRRKLRKI